MGMNANEQLFFDSMKKIADEIRTSLPKVPGTIDGCCDALRIIIFWDTNWVEARRQEAHGKYNEVQPKAQEFLNKCDETCAIPVNAASMRDAATAYAAIDWNDVLTKTSTTSIMGSAEDWTSTNKELYRAKVEQIKPKIEAIKAHLEVMIKAMETMDSTLSSWIIGGLNCTAGLVLALAGLCVALDAGWTGVGAIIGLVIAVASFLYALAQFFLLPDLHGTVQGQSELVKKDATTLDGQAWPAKVNLIGTW